MSTTWKKVSLVEAKAHPLYGVKNWLAVFAFGVLLSLLKEIGSLSGEAHKAGLTLSQLLAIDHPAITFAKIVLAVNVVVVSVIYWMLITKHPKFRRVASALLLLGWPTIVLVGGINPFVGLGGAIVMSLLPWALSCAIWVTYLQRSKRVRVTFEHSVVSDEMSSTAPKNQQAPLPTPGIHSRQSSMTTAQPIPSPYRAEMSAITATPPPKEISHASKPSTPSEECWSIALGEFDSTSRRAGLWARMFSEAEGNEAIAKAGYLRSRAVELEGEQASRVKALRREEQSKIAALQDQAADAEARKREVERVEAERAYAALAALAKGVCPNRRCMAIIPLNSQACPKCGAIFEDGATWKVVPWKQT